MNRISFTIVLTSSILLGLTLVISGTGKIPGQTEFADALLKSFWTPVTAKIIAYGVPWYETVIGALLISGIALKISTVLCLPLIGGFFANNVWALFNGKEQFPECANCFGVWEQYTGSLTPMGAFIFDMVLLLFIVLILVFSRDRFFSLKPWYINREDTANG